MGSTLLPAALDRLGLPQQRWGKLLLLLQPCRQLRCRGEWRTILSRKLHGYPTICRTTVGQMLAAGFEVLPTIAAPHHTVVIPSLDVVVEPTALPRRRVTRSAPLLRLSTLRRGPAATGNCRSRLGAGPEQREARQQLLFE